MWRFGDLEISKFPNSHISKFPNIIARMSPRYGRVLLKLSGEALMGEQQFGIDPAVTTQIATDIAEIQGLGVQVAVVIGGGDRLRGLPAGAQGKGTPSTPHLRPPGPRIN